MVPFKQYRPSQTWVVFVSLAVTFFLVGCAAEAPTAPQTLETCQTNNPLIYTGASYPEFQSEQAKQVANEIYSIATQGDLPKAKREGLRFLWYETQRWSDVEYHPFDTLPKVRIIATFLTPGLIRAIVLNNLLFNYDPSYVANLDAETNTSLEKMDKRQEFAFLLIVQSDESATINTFSIPSGEVLLRTTAGRQVRNTHNDNFENISLRSKELYSGLLFYPAAAVINGVCSPVLEPNIETSLLLLVDRARWGDQVNIGFNWQFVIPLFVELNKPLFNVRKDDLRDNDWENNSPMADIQLAPNSFLDQTDSVSWREVGRYVWYKLIMDQVPKIP